MQLRMDAAAFAVSSVASSVATIDATPICNQLFAHPQPATALGVARFRASPGGSVAFARALLFR